MVVRLTGALEYLRLSSVGIVVCASLRWEPELVNAATRGVAGLSIAGTTMCLKDISLLLRLPSHLAVFLLFLAVQKPK